LVILYKNGVVFNLSCKAKENPLSMASRFTCKRTWFHASYFVIIGIKIKKNKKLKEE